MSQYRCEFRRYGDISITRLIDAESDALAFIAAEDHLAERPIYLSVEIFEGERRVGRLDLPPKAGLN
jgi:hypothetical protein